MKNFLTQITIAFSVCALLFATAFPVYAVEYTNKDGITDPKECENKECGPFITCTGNNCDFGDFMQLINNIINFLLFTLAPLFATITFAWGGFLILTSGGNSGAVTRAKKMMWNVALGYIIALSSWLIVKLIFNTELVNDKFLFFLK